MVLAAVGIGARGAGGAREPRGPHVALALSMLSGVPLRGSTIVSCHNRTMSHHGMSHTIP
jgi:hypothetical protein